VVVVLGAALHLLLRPLLLLPLPHLHRQEGEEEGQGRCLPLPLSAKACSVPLHPALHLVVPAVHAVVEGVPVPASLPALAALPAQADLEGGLREAGHHLWGAQACPLALLSLKEGMLVPVSLTLQEEEEEEGETQHSAPSTQLWPAVSPGPG
jgi:hypothetical protein